MTINWYIAGGQAMKTGLDTYRGLTDTKQTQLKNQAMQLDIDNQRGLQQDMQTLDPNSPTYNQDVQAAMARHGQPLQSAQYGTASAQGEGLRLKNTQQKSIMDVGREAHDFYNGVTGMVGSGDIVGGAKAIADKARELNMPVAFDQSGTKMSVIGPDGKPSGQTYDLSDPHVQYAAAGFLQNGIIKNRLLQADPTMYPQIQNSDSQATSANASMTNAIVNKEQSPSVMAKNNASAAASNADASLAPAKANYYNSQASEAGARSKLYGAQTTGVDNSNTAESNYQTALHAYQTAMQNPEYAGSPQQANDERVLTALSPKSGAGYLSSQLKNDATNDTRRDTAQTAADARRDIARMKNANGVAAGSNFKESATVPGLWVDAKNPGRTMQFDQKGTLVKINGAVPPGGNASPGGVQVAKGRDGRTGYRGADGNWYGSEREAMATFVPAGGEASPRPLQGTPISPGQPGNAQIPAGPQTAAIPGIPR